MYSFKNDYSEGAHPRLLNALLETNFEQVEGYGEDCYTQKASAILKERIGRNDIDIHLLSGGTQTNLTAISAFIRPHEAVIAANTGHILVHETGAIEATGHKIIAVEVGDGKLNSLHIKAALDSHTDEHMVKPRLVYISNPTEIGSIYNRKELEQVSRCCRDNNLFLFMDGARLGSALCCEENDLELSELAALVDAFYIGGTKNGALLGEALVICCDALKQDFRFHMKQKGALLAKGKLLGVQFLELFRDNLYFDLAKHANAMAGLLREEISQAGFGFLVHSPSNQIFPILPDRMISELQKNYSFYVWSKVDMNNSAVRLVTSWATQEEAVLAFIKDFKALL
ncbi:aminotransferase class I/II-fold pyridoxal phosphate-dependent enzyme [Desulfosporosinus sp. PR]|uniref:threonine aldolase family protein n=1 Tax=Candidatus Desulfosporosinus nitrosoreducens TaxID=3401928 RepID=UPI0027FCA020|nr:aminotransferase class I/II-fold pyridoxal phosphate-dependent enzyme [Desulfosporosinus sp. PR]MDQ7094065.1 aminotransferase class I/II-fold pyridoxal phosphate-dependent enzyme [Desulfosporosinus sp. PR]